MAGGMAMTDPRRDATDTLAGTSARGHVPQWRDAAGRLQAVSPSRNDGVTMTRATCEACGRAFRPVGRRRFCSDGCRQAAWRRRHSIPGTSGTSALGSAEGRLSGKARRLPPPLPAGEVRSARPLTVYECPSCGARYLGAQRCPDCGLFCRRVGPGGRCPHCDEPVAVADLIAEGEG